MGESKWFTGSGDSGDTQLLGNKRVPKHHPQPEAYGTVDEASAVLGIIRSVVYDDFVRHIVYRVQTHLHQIMSELAATPEKAAQYRFDGAKAVAWLNEQVDKIGADVTPPKAFVIPGKTYPEALFHHARTVVRRAERRVSQLFHDGLCTNKDILAYLNRLSSLCFVLACREYPGEIGTD